MLKAVSGLMETINLSVFFIIVTMIMYAGIFFCKAEPQL